MLLKIREMILRRAGYEVCSFNSTTLVYEVEIAQFDIVLLCRSLPWEKAEAIGCSIRSLNPDLPIIRLSSSGSRGVFLFDRMVEGVFSPLMLLRDIEDLRRPQAAGASPPQRVEKRCAEEPSQLHGSSHSQRR